MILVRDEWSLDATYVRAEDADPDDSRPVGPTGRTVVEVLVYARAGQKEGLSTATVFDTFDEAVLSALGDIPVTGLCRVEVWEAGGRYLAHYRDGVRVHAVATRKGQAWAEVGGWERATIIRGRIRSAADGEWIEIEEIAGRLYAFYTRHDAGYRTVLGAVGPAPDLHTSAAEQSAADAEAIHQVEQAMRRTFPDLDWHWVEANRS